MAKTVGGKEYNEEGLVKKTKRRLKELFYGKRTYMPGHKMMKVDKSKRKSTRTKQVESGLKQAGLSESDMAKFRSKK